MVVEEKEEGQEDKWYHNVMVLEVVLVDFVVVVELEFVVVVEEVGCSDEAVGCQRLGREHGNEEVVVGSDLYYIKSFLNLGTMTLLIPKSEFRF